MIIGVGRFWYWNDGISWWHGRYLNDKSYYGGFEQKELDQMFEAMKCNYGAWVSGFAPRALGVAEINMNSQAVIDFSRTLLSMRPDVALNVSMTIFQSDFRSILPQVSLDQTPITTSILRVLGN